MTGEPKKRSEHEREPDEYEPGSVNNSRYRAQRGPRESIRHEGVCLTREIIVRSRLCPAH